MKITRREFVVGSAAVAAASCGAVPFDDDGLAASEPEDDEMNAAYTKPDTTPIHVTATTPLSANSAGGVNAISLKNPTPEAMEILEIKWQIICATTQFTLGGTVACKLSLGKYALTNGYVPVAMFGRSEGLISEQMNDLNTGGKCCNEYTWRLPRPLYVPKDAVLMPLFQHRGNTQIDANVRISYSGRSIPDGSPPPKKVSLPYAAFWASKTFDIATAGVDNSAETDLVNPFEEPLQLQRMVGRVFNTALSANLNIDDGQSFTSESAASNFWNTRMVDSFGHPVIRRFIPFRMAYSATTRSWDMAPGTVMGPKSYYTAYMRKDASTLTANSILTQAIVSLVGWRDVVGGAS